MTPSPQNHEEKLQPFGKLLSLLGLLAVGLYFTGWIYRWTYFGFFQVDVTALNLPLESFYLAAFRALSGHPFIFLRTIIFLGITVLLIIVTLQIIQEVWQLSVKYIDRYLYWRRITLNLTSPQLSSLKFLSSLVNELVIILGILTTLFFLAQWQADSDAFTDAVNETSRLPVVTIVIPEENAGLGSDLGNPLVNPSGFRIIGDSSLYERLLGRELTDTSNPNQPRVWRLLIDREGYFYIFPALPKKERNRSVPILIIYESANGDQLTILGPAKTSEQ